MPRRFAVVLFAFLALSSQARADFAFRGLGGLPSPDLLSSGNSISASGLVVAGTGNVEGGLQAIRWTADSGMSAIGDLPGGNFSSQAHGISPDGSFIVGSSSSVNGFEAFLWSASGMIGLGDLPGVGSFSSVANAVSRSGEVVVGASQRPFGPTQYAAFRWTLAHGIQHLGELPGGDNFSIATDVSDDGSIIVGGSASSAGSEAFIWTESGGMVGMGDLPGGGFSSSAQAISSDGSVIVGGALSDRGFEAFRWTQAGGMEGLCDLPGGIFSSGANAVSADGNVVVGSASGIGDSDGAFLWTRALGMVSLKFYLKENGITGLDGWHLTYARGVSADGRTIVGTGVNPQGLFEGWIATIDLGVLPIDAPEIAPPMAIFSLVGSTAGGIAEIQFRDDRYLGFRARGSELMQAVVESRFSGAATSHIVFEMESRASRSGTSQRVEFYDFDSGRWFSIDSRGVPGVDTLTSVTVTNAARFVEAGTLRLRARISWQNTQAKRRNITDVFVDAVSWTRIP